jgi:hypothetical protein
MRALGESAEEHALSISLGCTSYRFYKKIAEGSHKDFHSGSLILPCFL